MHRKPALYAACVAAVASLALSSAGTASADNHDNKRPTSSKSGKEHRKDRGPQALLPTFNTMHACRAWGKKAVHGPKDRRVKMKHFWCEKNGKGSVLIHNGRPPGKKSGKRQTAGEGHHKPQTQLRGKLHPRERVSLRSALEPAEQGKEAKKLGFRSLATRTVAAAVVPAFDSARACQTWGNEMAQQAKVSYFSCVPMKNGAVVMDDVNWT